MAELPIPTLEPLPELPNLEMLNSIGFPQPSTFSPVLKGMLDNEVPEGSNKIAVMKDTLSVFNPDQNMIVTAGYLMNILEEVQRLRAEVENAGPNMQRRKRFRAAPNSAAVLRNAGKRVIHHCVATWTPLSNEMKMKGLLGIDAEPTPHYTNMITMGLGNFFRDPRILQADNLLSALEIMGYSVVEDCPLCVRPTLFAEELFVIFKAAMMHINEIYPELTPLDVVDGYMVFRAMCSLTSASLSDLTWVLTPEQGQYNSLEVAKKLGVETIGRVKYDFNIKISRARKSLGLDENAPMDQPEVPSLPDMDTSLANALLPVEDMNMETVVLPTMPLDNVSALTLPDIEA